MARGGARPGAGRKPGIASAKNAIAEKINEQHALILDEHGNPLFSEEVLNSDPLSTIELYRKVHLAKYLETSELAHLKEAVSAAREAAPFFHAKKQSIVQETININPHEQKSTAELATDVFGPNVRVSDEPRPN